jgi:hypothetical protein
LIPIVYIAVTPFTMKYTFLFLTVAFSFSTCNRLQSSSDGSNDAASSHGPEIISADTMQKLLYSVPRGDSLTKENDFTSLKEFPKTWISLVSSEFGAVIYKRGSMISRLVIQNDSIVAIADEIQRSKILGFERIGPSQYHIPSEQGSMNYTFEVFDQTTMLTLVKWKVVDGDKILGEAESFYVPKEKEYLFKHIDEPPRNTPGSSLKLYEVNVDSVRAKYRRQ